MRFTRLQTWIDSQYENPRGVVGTRGPDSRDYHTVAVRGRKA